MLGTGTSHGVPVLGCNCKTCLSDDPRDFRTRSSVYLQTNNRHIIIDTATEFRLQTLKNKVPRVDLVLFTHKHADHISGFDDLRRFNQLQAGLIPVYGNGDTIESIKCMFPYIFDDTVQEGGGKPQIGLNEINQPFSANEVEIIPIPVFHGQMRIFGYRIGDFAYITDCSLIPAESLSLLKNLKLLVLGVLRYRAHPTHFNLETGLEVISLLRPERCYLTHLAHDFQHEEVNKILPENVELGYDGLRIEIL